MRVKKVIFYRMKTLLNRSLTWKAIIKTILLCDSLMILGIGNDIIEVVRIKTAIERYQQKFLNRLFTPTEQAYCLSRKDSSLHFAGRFAAKEAVSKALGTGFSQGLTWLDIEIYNDPSGKPSVRLSAKANDLFDTLNFTFPSAIAISTQRL